MRGRKNLVTVDVKSCHAEIDSGAVRKESREQSIMPVLFYNDVADFGGHEAMTLRAVKCLSQCGDLPVSAMYSENNHRFRDGLADIARVTGNLELLPLPFSSKSLQAFRSLISFRKIAYLIGLMKQINPRVVVVSQGRIEACSMGLLAAKRAGFRTISYLPMAHSVSVSGKPVALWLRDSVNEHFYRLPDKIITISDSARKMLLERSAQDVVVVPNGIEVRPMIRGDHEKFREECGIGKEEYVIGTIGRIDFRQKGQDFALQAIRRFQRQLEGYKFVFVGDGPDAQRLKAMIAKAGLSRLAQVLPWCSDPGKIYAGLDMLMIPSKYEGVPLVMLEAMANRLPIIASNSDGMAELLPQNWLFPFGDHQALVDRLAYVRNADNGRRLESHRELVLEQFTGEKFCANVSAAILERTPAEVELCSAR
jgi:glycosyltransferase involved in cell wall biosynthesis